MENKIGFGETEYTRLSSCSFGDYGGCGSVGLANIQTLEENHKDSIFRISMGHISHFINDNPDYYLDPKNTTNRALDYRDILNNRPELIIEEGGYNSLQAWIRSDIGEKENYTGQLEHYPLLNDKKLGEIENDWEIGALKGWALDDLLRTKIPDFKERQDFVEQKGFDFFLPVYRDAMEKENEQAVAEHNGSYIPADRIEKTFLELLDVKLKA